MSQDPTLCLHHCSVCKFDINHREWKLCRAHDCPVSFTDPAIVRLGDDDTVADQSAEASEKPLSVATKRAFVAASGMHCPQCGITNIQPLDQPDPVANNKITRMIGCENGHVWHEVYTLSNVLTPNQHDALYPLPASQS